MASAALFLWEWKMLNLQDKEIKFTLREVNHVLRVPFMEELFEFEKSFKNLEADMQYKKMRSFLQELGLDEDIKLQPHQMEAILDEVKNTKK